jgi:hypothetical protein
MVCNLFLIEVSAHVVVHVESHLFLSINRIFFFQEEPKIVAATLKEKLDAFKVYLPLIQALRTPGMRERHWAKLSQEVQVRSSLYSGVWNLE